MQNFALVRVVNCFGDGFEKSARFDRGQGTLTQQFGHVLSFHVFHGKKVLTVMFADLMNGYDVGMLEGGGGLGLALKTFDQFVF